MEKKDVKKSIAIAGGQGQGSASTQFSYLRGLFAGTSDTDYVADELNHRVLHWSKGAQQSKVIVRIAQWKCKSGSPMMTVCSLLSTLSLSLDISHTHLHFTTYLSAKEKKIFTPEYLSLLLLLAFIILTFLIKFDIQLYSHLYHQQSLYGVSLLPLQENKCNATRKFIEQTRLHQ